MNNPLLFMGLSSTIIYTSELILWFHYQSIQRLFPVQSYDTVKWKRQDALQIYSIEQNFQSDRHVDRSCVGLSPHCYHRDRGEPTTECLVVNC